MKLKKACLLLTVLTLSLMLIPLSATAEETVLEWVSVGKPALSGVIVVSPSEVSEIAPGRSGTVYAADSVNGVVYKSTNDGTTWDDISSSLTEAGASLPAGRIAVAPDTNSTVALVADSGTGVYLSTDSGSTWSGLSVPALTATIQAIAISRPYTEGGQTIRDIAIGTAQWGNNTTTGQVWIFPVGSLVPSWQDQGLTIDQTLSGGEVAAIAFSPGYQNDNTIIVVAAAGSDTAAAYQNKTWLCLGKRDTAAGTTDWSYFGGYPVEVGTVSSPSAGDAPGATLSASLDMPSNYSSSDADLMKLFVSYDRTPGANDDVYRFEDTTVTRLNAANGANIDISSIAYYGTTSSGKLLLGEVNQIGASPTVRVRRTANPLATSPEWRSAATPPSGPGNAKVAWNSNGSLAYCGTGQDPGAAFDESAFSTSTDNGDNWQQTSLMDTTLFLSDITVSPSSDTLFAATYSSFGPEGIWRSTSTQGGIGEFWSRQLTMSTASDRVILRTSPDYASDYTIYAVETGGGDEIAVSNNRGNSWKRRNSPGSIVDVAVEDENTLYAALPNGYVIKSTNAAFFWGEPVFSGIADINMLDIADDGTIFIGGRDGEVAYSTDSGVSFIVLERTIGNGDVQVVPDAAFTENSIIYAATDAADKGIWRWTLDLSTGWEQINEAITSLGRGEQISGLAVAPEGTLYALRAEAAGGSTGGMTRTLDPTASENEIEFSFSNDGLPAGASFDSASVFPNTLPYLKISGDAERNDLWAIDTANELIYRFRDTLSKPSTAPAVSVISPQENFSNPVNPVTGTANDVSFLWSRVSGATSYSLEIATDPDFLEMVTTVNVTGNQPAVSAVVGPSRSGAQRVNWQPGGSYYWRVRATAPLASSYSAPRTVIIEPLPARVPSLLTPANGTRDADRTPSFSWEPEAGINSYRFMMADNPEFNTPLVDAILSRPGYAVTDELEYGKTYFWRVRAVSPVESSWSSVANFTVMEKPADAPPPSVVTEVPPVEITRPEPSQTPEVIILPTFPEPAPTIPPVFIWVIIIIISALVTALIFLIYRTRHP